jgi:hypothetical protein
MMLLQTFKHSNEHSNDIQYGTGTVRENKNNEPTNQRPDNVGIGMLCGAGGLFLKDGGLSV